jgi:hypothetical protein
MRSIPNLELFNARRLAFAERLTHIDPADVMSVDEASFDSNMAPLHGYSLKGQRLFIPMQRRTRRRVTLTLAVSNTGLQHWTIVPGSSNRESFLTFLRGLAHCPQRYVLMDNVAFHHSRAVAELLLSMGKIPLFIPPYSPEFNPIENVFSYLKWMFRPRCYAAVGVAHDLTLQSCLQDCHEVAPQWCGGAFRATWAFLQGPHPA